MTTIEPRSLLTDLPKLISIPKEIEKVFDVWLNKTKQKTDISKIKLLEIFYAGYILSNPIARQEYINADKIINKK